MQLSVAVRNALLDALESATGPSPILTIRTGAAPANCAAANTGTVLATPPMPADWSTAASGGSKSILGGPWTVNAAATGTAAHFRIHDSGGTICHWQGTVGLAGSGADLIVDSVSLTSGQSFSITGFSMSAPHA